MTNIIKAFFIFLALTFFSFTVLTNPNTVPKASADTCFSCLQFCTGDCVVCIPYNCYTGQYNGQYTTQYTSQTPIPTSTPPGIPPAGCAILGGTCQTSCPAGSQYLAACQSGLSCCSGAPLVPGFTVINQQCRAGQWVTTSSSCQTSCTPSSLPPCDTGTNACGNCSFACGQGTQTCQHNQSSRGGQCTPTNFSNPCNQVCPQGQNCVSNVCVAAKTINGNVFLDTNKNSIKDAGESNYTGSINITSTGGTVSSGAGAYTVNNLSNGTYTVSYNNIPTGYVLTYPLNGPPPSFTVQVGSPCSVGGSNSASCDGSGNITNLNFGITNSNPWIQVIGNDGRIDSGFNNAIPAGASCGAYASIPGGQGAPGLIFSGASSYNFGQGQASQDPYNWVAGGLTYPDVYGPTRTGGLVKTGFAFLQSKASQAGLNIIDIAAYCTGGIANCTLPGTLPHGVYQASGNMTIAAGSYTFPSGQNYVILVNGDLTIKGKIFVPNGSTAVFSASGNINVDKSVGEASPSSTASDIEGIYSADKNFTVQGTNNCSVGNDLRFNVSGAVITNAAGGGGSFQNQRDLCAGNVSCPAFSSIARPDLILNTPDFMKQANFTYQEIAP